MMQEINFYRSPALRHGFELTASNMARVIIGSVFLCGLISTVSVFESNGLRSKLRASQESLNAHEARLNELRQMHPEPEVDRTLLSETGQLQQRVDKMRKLLALAEDEEWSRRGGFTRLFEGLARRTLSNVWLTSIRFKSGGNDLELTGKALESEKIPQLVQALGLEVSFKSKSFADLVIHRGEQSGSPVEFVLRSGVFTADKDG